MPDVHVTVLCPSLEEESYTRTALERACSSAERAGASTDLIDVRSLELVPYSRETDADTETALELWDRLDPADSVRFGTPVFVHSCASALALAFEYLDSDVPGGKTMGLLAVAEAPDVAPARALDDLRLIGQRFGAWVLPHRVTFLPTPRKVRRSGRRDRRDRRTPVDARSAGRRVRDRRPRLSRGRQRAKRIAHRRPSRGWEGQRRSSLSSEPPSGAVVVTRFASALPVPPLSSPPALTIPVSTPSAMILYNTPKNPA